MLCCLALTGLWMLKSYPEPKPKTRWKFSWAIFLDAHTLHWQAIQKSRSPQESPDCPCVVRGNFEVICTSADPSVCGPIFGKSRCRGWEVPVVSGSVPLGSPSNFICPDYPPRNPKHLTLNPLKPINPRNNPRNPSKP